MCIRIFLMVLLLAVPATAHAQGRTPKSIVQPQPFVDPHLVAMTYLVTPRMELAGELATPITAHEPRGSVGASASLGLLFGAVGFYAGGLAAGHMGGCDGDDYCALEKAFYGAAALGTAGLALGVHMGNARQGNYAADLAVAGAVWLAGYGLVRADGLDSNLSVAAFFLTPVAQLIVTTAVEHSIGRARAREEEAALDLQLGPDGRGGLALGASIRF